MAETNAGVVQDEMIQKQKEAIEKEIQAEHKLIGDVEDVSALENQFANDPVFLKNATQLQKNHKALRRTRPDGNCMYRAVAFGQFERMLHDSEEAKRFKKCVEEAKEEMIKQGFPVFTMEDFYDNFMENLNSLSGEKPITLAEVEEMFREVETVVEEQENGNMIATSDLR